MIRSEGSVYKGFRIVSRKSSKKFREGRSAPTPQETQVVKSLKEIVRLCGDNISEAARRIGVSQPRLYQWIYKGNAPDDVMIAHICRVFGINEAEFRTGVFVGEKPEKYGISPVKQKHKKILKAFDELIESNDPEVLEHLERQINLLLRLSKRDGSRLKD